MSARLTRPRLKRTSANARVGWGRMRPVSHPYTAFSVTPTCCATVSTVTAFTHEPNRVPHHVP